MSERASLTIVTRLRNHYALRNLRESLRQYLSDRLTVLFLLGFLLVLFLAVFGPVIAALNGLPDAWGLAFPVGAAVLMAALFRAR